MDGAQTASLRCFPEAVWKLPTFGLLSLVSPNPQAGSDAGRSGLMHTCGVSNSYEFLEDSPGRQKDRRPASVGRWICILTPCHPPLSLTEHDLPRDSSSPSPAECMSASDYLLTASGRAKRNLVLLLYLERYFATMSLFFCGWSGSAHPSICSTASRALLVRRSIIYPKATCRLPATHLPLPTETKRRLTMA